MDSIGFHITEELIEEWYDCSPKNCVAFATTGGDGVHFSIFKDSDVENSPVVMTVPMNFGEENMVIANSLYEFLCLGCKFGYFNLEQLSYDYEATVQEIESCNKQELKNQELLALSIEFKLSPINEVTKYINDTNATHINKLELEDA